MMMTTQFEMKALFAPEAHRASGSPPPLSSADPELLERVAAEREECLGALGGRYARSFFLYVAAFLLVGVPLLLAMTEDEEATAGLSLILGVVGLGAVAALVTRWSLPGRRLVDLERFLRGEIAELAPAPALVLPRASVEASALAPPPLLLRALYFLAIGSWLGIVWGQLSWIASLPPFFCARVGRAMTGALPVVQTLARSERPADTGPVGRSRIPWPLSVLYFCAVGSWLSLALTETGVLMTTLIVPSRPGLWLLRHVPYVMTLRPR